MFSSTATSLRPCPENRVAHYFSQVRSLYICLVEDRGYRRGELERAVREVLVGVSDVSPSRIVSEVAEFLADLREAVVASIRVLHGGGDLVDISLPRVSDESVNPGEFTGSFIVFDDLAPRVVLHVEPKIGWGGYVKMLEETRRSLDVLVSTTGVLEPLIGNLYYPILSSPVSYSLLLLKLTELILASAPPKKTSRVEVVSEGAVGRPVVYKTVKYQLQGIPLGVYERVRVELHDYPFILLARFHHDLVSELTRILSLLKSVSRQEDYYWLVAESISILQDLHLHYLTTPPLGSFYNVALREEISPRELVDETRRAARANPYFGLLADLYEMYLADVGLIHRYAVDGRIAPSASCKIYELWVLTRIMSYFGEEHGLAPSVEEYRDLYVRFKLGDVKLVYNMPRRGPILKTLRKYGVLARGVRLRPDFVLKRDRSAVVYDAKYKVDITLRDVVAILAYIAEYAEPTLVDNERALLGTFYKLARDPEKPEQHSALRDTRLPVKVEVRVFTLDPRMKNSEVKNAIKQSLQPLFTST